MNNFSSTFYLTDCNWSERYKIGVLSCQKENYQQLVTSIKNYGIYTVDFGASIAEWIEKDINSKYLELEVQEFVQELVESGAKILNGFRTKTIAIHNLGILFEPALHINPTFLIKELSVQYCVLLIWENCISNEGRLYWKDSLNKYFIDFTDIYVNYWDYKNEI